MNITCICFFNGDYAFLSNFYRCKVPFMLVDRSTVLAESLEHAYQASKSLDTNQQKLILAQPSAGKAKLLGKKIDCRPDWDSIKLDVMYKLLKTKFKFNEDLRIRLLATGEAFLIEGNGWGDRYWGAELVKEDETNETIFIGYNHLGNLLMKVRKEFSAR